MTKIKEFNIVVKIEHQRSLQYKMSKPPYKLPAPQHKQSNSSRKEKEEFYDELSATGS